MLCPNQETSTIGDWMFALEISRDKQREAEREAASLLSVGRVEQARIVTTSARAYKKAAAKFERYLREMEKGIAEVERVVLAAASQQPEPVLLWL